MPPVPGKNQRPDARDRHAASAAPGGKPAPRPITPAKGGGWHRQPIAWLGIAVFLASLAGCLWLIVASMQHADQAIATSRTVFGVPAKAHANDTQPRR